MPDAPAAAPAGGGGGKGQVLDPTKQALFSLCFIYAIYWTWLRVQEVNNFLGREAIKPLFVLIGIICGPVLIYVDWLFVNAIPEMQKKAGIEAKDEKIVDLLSLLCCAPYGVYRLQQKFNATWQK
jgi:hypothetical protein